MSLHRRFLKTVLKAGSPRARAARMKTFTDLMDLRPRQRVLDLGGTTKLWRLVDIPLNITVLNLDGQEIDEHRYGAHDFTIVRGDATDVTAYGDNSFDLVFSNSCIEHVGPPEKQADFAREVRRLAPSYYVQTPAIGFPIEAHTGLPFWWAYPKSVRDALVRRWAATRPGYAEFINGTRVLRRGDLRRFFPDGKILPEKFMGLTKSHTVWRRA